MSTSYPCTRTYPCTRGLMFGFSSKVAPNIATTTTIIIIDYDYVRVH